MVLGTRIVRCAEESGVVTVVRSGPSFWMSLGGGEMAIYLPADAGAHGCATEARASARRVPCKCLEKYRISQGELRHLWRSLGHWRSFGSRAAISECRARPFTM